MATGGFSCIDREGAVGTGNPTRTMFIKSGTFTAGDINHFCVYTTNTPTAGTCKLKVFRQNGTNIDFVAESSSQTLLSSRSNSFNISPITVQAGDYIGVCFSGAQSAGSIESDNVGSGGDVYFRTDDVSSNTAESSWTLDTQHTSISLGSSLPDVYVDINRADDSGDGRSWATAKKTVNAGISLLSSGDTLHIATGDYSGQTAITINVSQYWSIEDPNSTGSKNVKAPPTA